ncbi:MAG: helix-turn-helix domain-containing protein [Phycisphaeraceae bacterium]
MAEHEDRRHLRPAPLITGVDRCPVAQWYRRPRGVEGAWLILMTTGGRGRVGTRAGDFALQRGDVLLFRPGAPLAYGSAPGCTWLRAWALFVARDRWLDWLDWPAIDEAAPEVMRLGPLSREAASPVRVALVDAHQYYQGAQPRRDELAMNRLEAALLACDAVNPRAAVQRLDGRLRRAMEMLAQRMDEPWTLEDVAEAADMSAAQLNRLFRAQVGLTPMRFLEQRRLDRAAALLQMTAEPIAAVAERVGYVDAFYFSTRFRRCFGVSPRAFRAGALSRG